MGAIVTTVVYLILAIAIAAVVGLALSRSGRAFLGARFGADDGVALAVNRLVLVAYSLLTGGFIALTMPSWSHVAGLAEALRLLSARLGVLLLALGALHLTATAVFARLRRAQSGPAPSPSPSPAPAPAESAPGDEVTPSALWQPRRVAH